MPGCRRTQRTCPRVLQPTLRDEGGSASRHPLHDEPQPSRRHRRQRRRRPGLADLHMRATHGRGDGDIYVPVGLNMSWPGHGRSPRDTVHPAVVRRDTATAACSTATMTRPQRQPMYIRWRASSRLRRSSGSRSIASSGERRQPEDRWRSPRPSMKQLHPGCRRSASTSRSRPRARPPPARALQQRLEPASPPRSCTADAHAVHFCVRHWASRTHFSWTPFGRPHSPATTSNAYRTVGGHLPY